jgi:LAS superfamily LD-carboxypeptidase LdcB
MKRYMKTLAILVALICAVCAALAAPGILRNYRNRKMIEAVVQESRTPEEAARSYLAYRVKLAPTSVGPVSDEYVKALADDAVCLLDKLAFTSGEPEPVLTAELPPLVTCSNSEEAERYDAAMKLYDREFQEWAALHKLWEQNKSTRGNYVSIVRQFRWEGDKLAVERTEFSFKPNLRHYVDTLNLKLVSVQIGMFKYYMSWLNTTPDQFLQQPLDCVKDPHGVCIKQADGRACLLLSPLAQAVTEANKRMVEAGKGQIEPTECFRSNLTEAVAYAATSGAGCGIASRNAGMNLPGRSFHTMGLAMDLADESQAKDFLMDVGMVCEFIPGQPKHCSLGEDPNSRTRLRLHELRKTVKGTKDILEAAKEFKDYL